MKYEVNGLWEVAEVIAVYESSGIVRPTKDVARIGKMLNNSNLIVTAREESGELVGIARAVTDFSYCCYLSDLAVAKDYQKNGVGKVLIEKVQQEIGEEVALILLSAPGAMDYYPKVGFEKAENAFLIRRQR